MRGEKFNKNPWIVGFMSTALLGKDEKVQGLMFEPKKLSEKETQMVPALVN